VGEAQKLFTGGGDDRRGETLSCVAEPRKQIARHKRANESKDVVGALGESNYDLEIREGRRSGGDGGSTSHTGPRGMGALLKCKKSKGRRIFHGLRKGKSIVS